MPEEKDVFSTQRRQWKAQAPGGKLPMLRKLTPHRQAAAAPAARQHLPSPAAHAEVAPRRTRAAVAGGVGGAGVGKGDGEEGGRASPLQRAAAGVRRAEAAGNGGGEAAQAAAAAQVAAAAAAARAAAPQPRAVVSGAGGGDGVLAAERERALGNSVGGDAWRGAHARVQGRGQGVRWDPEIGARAAAYRDEHVPTGRAAGVVPLAELPQDLPHMARSVEALLDPLAQRVRQVHRRQSRLGSASDKVLLCPSPPRLPSATHFFSGCLLPERTAWLHSRGGRREEGGGR